MSSFEVASVKPAGPAGNRPTGLRINQNPGRIDYYSVSLKEALLRAYRLKRYQIVGPAWMETERYDISAKVPDGVGPDRIPEMLQKLLAERFKIKLHRETREQPVYALLAGKNPSKLKASEDAVGARGGIVMRDAKMEGRRTTISNLCDFLGFLLDRGVVDQTGLSGQYDFDLEVSPEHLAGGRKMGAGTDMPAPEGGTAASIFTSIQMIGLKLEARKLPVELLVIDRAERTPTEN